MQGISGAALVLLQDDPGARAHDMHFGMIFLCVIAICLVIQAIGFIAAGLVMAKLLKRMDNITADLQRRAGPILDKTNDVMIELVPKLRTLVTNLEEISTGVRGKMDEVGATVTQVNQTVQQINRTVQDANQTAQDATLRARAQVAHADAIVSDALASAQEISEKVQRSIRVPVRQVAGIVAGLKAGLETLIARSPFGSGSRGWSARCSGPRETDPLSSAPHNYVPSDPSRPYDV